MSLKEFYTESINTREQDQIIEEATKLVFGNPDREDVKKTIDILVGSLLGGFNAYKSVDEYLDNNFRIKKWWELGRNNTFENGNAGWAMCVKEMLDIMAEKIQNLIDEN